MGSELVRIFIRDLVFVARNSYRLVPPRPEYEGIPIYSSIRGQNMKGFLDTGSSGGGFRPGWLISSILTGAMEKIIEFNEI